MWLPSLVPAGLLGQVINVGPHRYRAVWPDREGVEWSAEFTTEREAVACVAAKAAGGMRFHDLRHAYATWLVTDGVPINLVQRVMGHEQVSTTLNRYTHTPDDYAARVLAAFDGSAAPHRGITVRERSRRGRGGAMTCGGAFSPERDDPRRGMRFQAVSGCQLATVRVNEHVLDAVGRRSVPPGIDAGAAFFLPRCLTRHSSRRHGRYFVEVPHYRGRGRWISPS
ncbi:tyrosine-type recombinase/integrase [Micromonospora sp. NPDC004540]|uniref:tyrosine-type recombinase/integrase n=1 Tax=Micromonospora sp. NPDC004540 TaxID=3154457 RepID=UPI0033ADD878